jgi:hypothetical protein
MTGNRRANPSSQAGRGGAGEGQRLNRATVSLLMPAVLEQNNSPLTIRVDQRAVYNQPKFIQHGMQGK